MARRTAMTKLLILALLIAVLVYPAGGYFFVSFVSKGVLRSRGVDEPDGKDTNIGRLR
jgi:hypothetical protein